MTRIIRAGSLVAALLFWPLAPTRAAQGRPPAPAGSNYGWAQGIPMEANNLVVVALKQSASITAVNAANDTTVDGADARLHLYLLALPHRPRHCAAYTKRHPHHTHLRCPTGLSTQLADLQATSGVVSAEPDEEVIVPEAQQHSRAFHESSMTSRDYVDQYALDLINADGAHGISTGQGVTVAEVDTGVDFSHPDLQGHLLPGYNVLDPSAAPADLLAGDTPLPYDDSVACTAGNTPPATPTPDAGTATEKPTPDASTATAIPSPAADTLIETPASTAGAVNATAATADGGSGDAATALDATPGSPDQAPTDATDDPANAAVGHGSGVAGVIAAVAPGACIMPVKVLDSAGQGTVFGVAEGIRYAVDNGAQIINLSLGTDRPSRTIEAALSYAAEHGVVVVASAGNTGAGDTTFPASSPHVLAVAATDTGDVRADFSTYGPFVGISAPGVDIYSTYYDGGYAQWSGTSLAAPFVSGEAALVLAEHPDAGAGDVMATIKASAANIDSLNPDYAGNLGAGRIDLAAAVSN